MTWSRSPPLTSTTTRPRAERMDAAPLLPTADAPRSVAAGELLERVRAEAVDQKGRYRRDAFRAVRGPCDRSQHEPPAAVLEREQHLLRLRVRQGKRDRPAGRRGRSPQDEEVAQHDARHDTPQADPGRRARRRVDPLAEVDEDVAMLAVLADAAE